MHVVPTRLRYGMGLAPELRRSGLNHHAAESQVKERNSQVAFHKLSLSLRLRQASGRPGTVMRSGMLHFFF